jgi:hypothetical protein
MKFAMVSIMIAMAHPTKLFSMRDVVRRTISARRQLHASIIAASAAIQVGVPPGAAFPEVGQLVMVRV